jgi:bifunctional DNA-binding transcriptional regulator/antitoxin component of YhaV-PrlF toxin-antitoxin module
VPKLSKGRQFTIPKQLCESAGLSPGDDLVLVEECLAGHKVASFKKAPVRDTEAVSAQREGGENRNPK